MTPGSLERPQWHNRLKGQSKWWLQTAALSSPLLTLVSCHCWWHETVPTAHSGSSSSSRRSQELPGDRLRAGQARRRASVLRQDWYLTWTSLETSQRLPPVTCFHVRGEQGTSNRPVSSAALWLWSQAPLKDVRISHSLFWKFVQKHVHEEAAEGHFVALCQLFLPNLCFNSVGSPEG